MGGTNKTTNANSTGTQFGSTTGSTLGNTTGTSSVTPYDAQLLSDLYAKLGVQPTGVTPGESTALNTISGIGTAGNPFQPGINNVASTLLAGGGPDRTPIASDAYSSLLSRLSPTANGDFTNPATNPFFANTVGTIGDDVTKRLEALYAGSGRDPAGAGGGFAQALARGVSEGTAPVFAGVYNNERSNQLNAAGNLYGAGNSTTGILSGLDQTRLANMQGGVNAAGAANNASLWGPQVALQAESQLATTPTARLQQLLATLLPGAQAFGTRTQTGATSGTSSGTSNAFGTGQQTKEESTPFNPMSLLPLAFLPTSGGSSLAGGLFSSLSNGFK